MAPPPPRHPRVSVIVPCFNLGEFLDEALASVEAETRHVLDTIAGRGTRVVHSDNRGLSAARNLGIRETTGEFLCCLDADDRLEPVWLEREVAVMDAEPTVDFVSHWLRAFGDEQWD